MLNGKKYIIAIANPSNSGKTATLKEVDKKLNTQRVYIDNEYGHDSDWITIFPYTNNGKTAKIGLTSFGDIAANLENILDDFIKEKCDIIICACHTSRSKMYKVVESKSSYERIFISNLAFLKNGAFSEKTKAHILSVQEKRFNTATATEVVNLVNDLVV